MHTDPPESRRRAASRLASFRNAFAGWWYVLRTQRNAWIHALASVAVFAVAGWLQLTRIEWMILVLTVALVWVAEIVNTAVEAVVDLLSPELHPLAKIAKDVAAVAVLLAALAAAAYTATAEDLSAVAKIAADRTEALKDRPPAAGPPIPTRRDLVPTPFM